MAAKKSDRKLSRPRRIAAIVCFLAIAPSILFGLRTFVSFRLLRSAYEAGAPMTSSIRPWMTLQYVATTFRMPATALVTTLKLPASTDPSTSLKTLADRARVAPSVYVEEVQRVIATLAPAAMTAPGASSSSWLATIEDQALTALLVYGYPALGLTLLLGAIGLPLPDGVTTTVAGSLAAQGRIDWFWAATTAVGASVLGDAIGYGFGRFVGQNFIERHGRWFGFTAARRARAQLLFDQWGIATVFITRTFMSYLSSIASILAGLSRYRLGKFIAATLIGRVLWTAGYFGLGYGIGVNWEAATGFLTNLSLLLLFLLVLVSSGAIASGRFATAQPD